MPSDSNYRFPAHPFSIEEALAVREKVSAFVHTAPLFGLESTTRGQGSGARSVVGLYVGVNRQAHLFGFEPETKTWKAVAVVPDGEVTTLEGMDLDSRNSHSGSGSTIPTNSSFRSGKVRNA